MSHYDYGDTMTVQALHQKSNADWGRSAKPYDRDVHTYAPPPGWAILANRVTVMSENNGSYGVSTFPGGSSFEERSEIEEAYDTAIAAAVSAQDFAAQADFEEQKRMMLSAMDQFRSSHNIIRLETEAWKAGTFYDRWGGWCEVKVEVDLMFICDPGCAGDIEQRLMAKIAPADPIRVMGEVENMRGVITQKAPTFGISAGAVRHVRPGVGRLIQASGMPGVITAR